MSRGFCPRCNQVVNRSVTQTNTVAGDEATYRRNRCPDCGQSYMSIEVAFNGEPSKVQWSKHWELPKGDSDE